MKTTQEYIKFLSEKINQKSSRLYCGKEYHAYDAKFCFTLTVFFKNGLQENKDGLLRFYNKAISVIGEENFTYYLVNDRGVYKKVNKDTLELFPFWLQDDSSNYPFFSLNLESDIRESMSDKAFKITGFTYPAQGYEDDDLGPDYWINGVRLVLPADYVITNGVENIISLMKEACHDLEFISGMCGYALNSEYQNADYLNENHTSNEIAPFAKIARRYHGIDIDKYERYVNNILNYCNNLTDEYHSLLGIKSVDWLTLLGHELIEKLGGLDNLSKQLKSGTYGDGIIIHKLPHGICIQAGPEPDVGDVNSSEEEILPYYHHVGRILKPVHFLQNEYGIYKNGVYSFESVEDTTKWLQRFDK